MLKSTWMQENMFTGKVFYKAAFCIVGPVHFFNVILLSYAIIIHLGIVHYWAATTLLLLIVGILSNALTIKYLAQRICKNRHFYLWILILFVLTSEQCLVSLRIVLLLYPISCLVHPIKSSRLFLSFVLLFTTLTVSNLLQ